MSLSEYMSASLDELEGKISNVMTDEEVKEALSLIEKVRHQYESDRPSKVPALDKSDSGTSVIVEHALMEGIVTNVNWTNETHGSEVTINVAMKEPIVNREKGSIKEKDINA